MKNHPLILVCCSVLFVGCASGPIDNIPSSSEANRGMRVEGVSEELDEADTYAAEHDPLGALRSPGEDGVGVAGRSFGSNSFFDKEAIFDSASPLAQRVFYFEYDRDTLSEQYLDTITDHGRYLATYPNALVRLEGHADERGTREYNIALAERRAQAVKRLMMLQGASYNQIITVSYGEEQPAVLGQTAVAYTRNRRVELVYE